MVDTKPNTKIFERYETSFKYEEYSETIETYTVECKIKQFGAYETKKKEKRKGD